MEESGIVFRQSCLGSQTISMLSGGGSLRQPDLELSNWHYVVWIPRLHRIDWSSHSSGYDTSNLRRLQRFDQRGHPIPRLVIAVRIADKQVVLEPRNKRQRHPSSDIRPSSYTLYGCHQEGDGAGRMDLPESSL